MIFSFRANWFIGIDSYTPHFKGNKHDIISIALEPLGSYEWIPYTSIISKENKHYRIFNRKVPMI